MTVPYKKTFVMVGCYYQITWTLLAAIAKVSSDFKLWKDNGYEPSNFMGLTERALMRIQDGRVALRIEDQIDQAARHIKYLEQHITPRETPPWFIILAAYVSEEDCQLSYTDPQFWDEKSREFALRVLYWKHRYEISSP